MNILVLCGSLRAQSTNLAVLQAAAVLAPADCKITLFGGLPDLPHFNPDLDADPLPDSVLSLREAIGAADALLISSPEYARGVAGAFKNALDWMVSSFEFPGKAVGVINASQRSTHADAALRLILATMAARLVDEACITLPLTGSKLDAAGIAADHALSTQLRAAIEALCDAASQEPAHS